MNSDQDLPISREKSPKDEIAQFSDSDQRRAVPWQEL
jgi:hypothetical protein